MKEPVLSVGIVNGKAIRFGLFGNFFNGTESGGFSGLYAASAQDGKLRLTSDSGSLTFSEEMIFSPEHAADNHFMLNDVIIGNSFHWERKEKEDFTGSLKLFVRDNSVHAVNIIPVEDYLTSVISSEMSPKSHIQFLKAHAIISRSWVLAQIFPSHQHDAAPAAQETENEITINRWTDRTLHDHFDVCADDHCQRYQGITKISSEAAREAASSTRGLILTYNNAICDTRFAKCCGGMSEEYHNVWDPVRTPYLSPVLDYKYEPENLSLLLREEEHAEQWIRNAPPAYCNTSDRAILSQILNDYDQQAQDYYRWKVSYSQQQIRSLIEEKTGYVLGDIIRFEPLQRGASGRLISLKIVGSEKTMIIGKELEIRKALSKSHLFSAAITFGYENITDGVPQKFIIYGAGWGHGVGLCQIGAAVMANQGYLFDEILRHYYPNAHLTQYYQ